jgi:hypothetical protein
MASFVKPVLFAGVCVGCLALGSGAQTPPPPTAPAPPTPAVVLGGQGGLPSMPGITATVFGDRMYYAHGFGAADAEALKLAKQLADAKSDAEKEKLRDKMKEVLDKAFDERQKRHVKEIEQLEAQIKKLKEMVEKRKKNKEEIIEERIKQLQREAAGLGW